MTYSPLVPQPPDIPAEGQDDFLSNFILLNKIFNNDHVPFSGFIANILQTNPCKIISPNHSLLTGNSVKLSNLYNPNADGTPTPAPVTGMGQLNGVTATITKIDDQTFSLNGVNAIGFTPYIGANLPGSSGGNYDSISLPSGYHKKISWPTPRIDPNLSPPYTSLYTKETDSLSEQFFQNNNNINFAEQLTSCTFVQGEKGVGLNTPWGIIINMGQITIYPNSGPTVQTFAIPFTTVVYTIYFGAYKGTSPFNSLTLTSFITPNRTSDPVTFYYIAIGK